MKPQRNAPLEGRIMGSFDAPIRLEMTDVCSTLRARNAVKAYISTCEDAPMHSLGCELPRRSLPSTTKKTLPSTTWCIEAISRTGL